MANSLPALKSVCTNLVWLVYIALLSSAFTCIAIRVNGSYDTNVTAANTSEANERKPFQAYINGTLCEIIPPPNPNGFTDLPYGPYRVPVKMFTRFDLKISLYLDGLLVLDVGVDKINMDRTLKMLAWTFARDSAKKAAVSIYSEMFSMYVHPDGRKMPAEWDGRLPLTTDVLVGSYHP